jgi:hypothetical protein
MWASSRGTIERNSVPEITYEARRVAQHHRHVTFSFKFSLRLPEPLALQVGLPYLEQQWGHRILRGSAERDAHMHVFKFTEHRNHQHTVRH